MQQQLVNHVAKVLSSNDDDLDCEGFVVGEERKQGIMMLSNCLRATGIFPVWGLGAVHLFHTWDAMQQWGFLFHARESLCQRVARLELSRKWYEVDYEVRRQ